nr:reverse transcriptase domain-containing protein [Tanacetum cinerariifolium]
MRNTLRKEQISQDIDKPASDAALREYCNRNYHQLLSIIAEKVHQEKGHQAEGRISEKRFGSRRIRSVFRSPEQGVADLGRKPCQKAKVAQEGTESQGQKSKGQALRMTIYPAMAKVERWAMPTWYHMFTSTLTGYARVWFDDLPPESVNSYDDLKEAFLANFRQQKKCIKDPVEIHHIKQREGESMEYFMSRFKVAAENQEWKKSLPPWKQPEAGHKHNFKKGGLKNQQRSELRHDRFTLLSKSPKEILALEKGKFKASPLMTTPVEKRNINKYFEFHGELVVKARSKNFIEKTLAWWDFIWFGMGAIIGVGIFVFLGLEAMNDASPAVVLSYVITGTQLPWFQDLFTHLGNLHLPLDLTATVAKEPQT